MIDKWIKCSERMPEQYKEVLIVDGGGSIYIAALNRQMTWDDGNFYDDISDITHWMPLPDAPNQEAE